MSTRYMQVMGKIFSISSITPSKIKVVRPHKIFSYCEGGGGALIIFDFMKQLSSGSEMYGAGVNAILKFS